MIKDDPNIGDSTSFDLSIRLGFSAEEHASMAGLPLSRRSTKELMKSYNEALDAHVAATVVEPLEELPEEPLPDAQETEIEKKDDGSSSGQMKLF